MRVVIAGGNGFIGRRLTTELIEGGHEVSWLSHRPGRAALMPESSRPDREFLFDPVGNVKDLTWRDALLGAGAVVNLSGTPIAARWNPAVKDLLRASRIVTGRALVDAISTLRPEDRPLTYVGASGIGIYGDRGDAILAENDDPGSDWLASLAVDWERETMRATDAGLRAVVIRTGLVLGPEGFLPRVALPMRLFAGGPVGSGRQYVPWIHHDDIARAYAHAVSTRSVTGPVNAVAPEQLTMREFAATLGHVLHRPSWMRVPTAGLKIVLGEVAPYTVFSQRAEPRALAASGFEFRFEHAEGALRDLLGR